MISAIITFKLWFLIAIVYMRLIGVIVTAHEAK
jgi:hypothetical protein